MRRIFAAALAATVVLYGVAFAQTEVRIATQPERTTLVSAWNLVSAAIGSSDQTVATATLADSTTFTIAGQPDQCRLINMTITDADSSITAGTVAITGTDCLGYARVCTFDFSVVATRGSGAKAVPVTTGPPASSCYLKTVTSVISSVLTGEGGAGDQIKVGYATSSPTTWALFGSRTPIGANGEHGVNPFLWISESLLVTTSGSSSTTLTSVASNGAFTNVAVGDLLSLTVNQTAYEAVVTARASADSVTISKAVNIPASGVMLRFKHFYATSDPTDQAWIPVDGYRAATLTWWIDSNTSTGGVTTSFQGLSSTSPSFASNPWVEIGPGDTNCTVAATANCTVNTATGTASAPFTKAVDLTLAHFNALRLGWKFGTSGTASSLNAVISLER